LLRLSMTAVPGNSHRESCDARTSIRGSVVFSKHEAVTDCQLALQNAHLETLHTESLQPAE
jgi:hypothetical protein